MRKSCVYRCRKDLPDHAHLRDVMEPFKELACQQTLITFIKNDIAVNIVTYTDRLLGQLQSRFPVFLGGFS
jgi:hypothetical protein